MANEYNSNNKYTPNLTQQGDALPTEYSPQLNLSTSSKKTNPYSIDLSQVGIGKPNILYSVDTSQSAKGKFSNSYSVDTNQSSTGKFSNSYSVDTSQSSNGIPNQIMSNPDLNQSSTGAPAQIMPNIDTNQAGSIIFGVRMPNIDTNQAGSIIFGHNVPGFIRVSAFNINQSSGDDGPLTNLGESNTNTSNNTFDRASYDLNQTGILPGPVISTGNSLLFNSYDNSIDKQYDPSNLVENLDANTSPTEFANSINPAERNIQDLDALYNESKLDPIDAGKGQLESRALEGVSAVLGLGSTLDSLVPLGTYETLPFSELRPNKILPKREKFQDFRQRLSLSSRRIDGTAAAIRGSITAGAYALASSTAPGGAYPVFNLQRNYGFPNYSTKTGKDFTQRSEVATVWNPVSGLNVKDSLKNPSSLLNSNNGAWEKTINPLETTKQFTGDKVTVIDFGQRTKDSIYQWKPDGLISNAIESVLGSKVSDFLGIGKTQDLIKFFFTGPKLHPGANNEKDDVIVFRAIINSMTDSFSAGWNAVQFVGRADPNYVYQGFSRNFDISFTVYASNRDELKPIYRKLNGLAGYTAPEYSDDTIVMKAPYLRLTVGDLFVQQPIALTSILYTFQDSETTWEINIEKDPTNMEVPKKIDVTLSGYLLTDYLPQKGGRFYTLAQEFDREGQPKAGNKDWLSDTIPTNATKLTKDDLNLRQLKKSFKNSDAFSTGKEAKDAATEIFEGL